MTQLFTAMFTALVTMGAIDAVWLTTMNKRFYTPRIGHLMAASPSFAPAIIFYVLYIFALAVLVILPMVKSNNSWLVVFLYGALFGLATYGTYDLTNQATLRDWPLMVTVVDLAWGALLTGTVTVIATYVTKHYV